jgi:biotin carboxylase
MLGASHHQTHVIRRAVESGIRVVTCDNRPENPGHAFAHESYEVSTTDVEGVLELATRLGVDGVLAYASDPAVLTAAYVADRLGLPGDPLKAVHQSQDKLLLRAAQKAAGLPAPEFVDARDGESLRRLHERLPERIVVKPVDSSGSRGVTVVPAGASAERLAGAVAAALAQSRAGRIVAEAFWGPGLPESVGDALVIEGRVRYLGLMTKASIARPGELSEPLGAGSFLHGSDARATVKAQVQLLVEALGLRNGVYNFDLRLDGEGEFAIIDFGARMGGSLAALLYRARDGIDLVGACLDIALGRRCEPDVTAPGAGHYSILVVRAHREGTFRALKVSDRLAEMLVASEIAARPGDAVRTYRSSGDQVGVMVLRSPVPDILATIAEDPQRFYTVVLNEDLP